MFYKKKSPFPISGLWKAHNTAKAEKAAVDTARDADGAAVAGRLQKNRQIMQPLTSLWTQYT